MAAPAKSVKSELQDLAMAYEMIRLGSRLQPIKEVTNLSYDRISNLYNEVIGKSPPKGMLPYSLDWYMTWKPNIHSSLFYWIYQSVKLNAIEIHGEPLDSNQLAWVLLDAYALYLANVAAVADHGADGQSGEEPDFNFTRAWTLLRFVESGQVKTTECQTCHGHFLIRADDHGKDYTCGVCRPPPRAGRRIVRG